MADVGMYVEEESHPRNPMNNEEGNLREGDIWENLNESRNDNPFELQQTIKELRAELKRVKEYNEHILKAREQLNNILLSKIHSNERDKNKEPELNMEKTTPYKCKGRKLEFSKHETEYSRKNQPSTIQKNIRILVKVVTVIKRKRNINLINKFSKN